jgi:aspartyl-tRNA(Asn)/glutamyl-tRNA(Gln) amidotransferase subunit B
MLEDGRSAREIVQQEGLAQVRDALQLASWVDEVLTAYPAEVSRFRDGDDKLLAFFMGQVMKKSRGKADPQQATDILRIRLSDQS